MSPLPRKACSILVLLTWGILGAVPVAACTGIRLIAEDGSVVFGRTMEWGTFDLNSRVVIIPRGHEFQSLLEGGEPGLRWKGKFGAVGLDALEKDFLVDGMTSGDFRSMCFTIPDSPTTHPSRTPT